MKTTLHLLPVHATDAGTPHVFFFLTTRIFCVSACPTDHNFAVEHILFSY